MRARIRNMHMQSTTLPTRQTRLSTHPPQTPCLKMPQSAPHKRQRALHCTTSSPAVTPASPSSSNASSCWSNPGQTACCRCSELILRVGSRVALRPLPCILEQLEPRRRALWLQANVLRVVWQLPCEEAALRVGHHCQVAAVCTAQRCNAQRGAVGVEGVGLCGCALRVNIPAAAEKDREGEHRRGHAQGRDSEQAWCD